MPLVFAIIIVGSLHEVAQAYIMPETVPGFRLPRGPCRVRIRLRLGSDFGITEGGLVDRDIALLGVKYEAAVVGGLQGAALEKISTQIASELGEDWKSDENVIHGRNAVRNEHGLPPLGGGPEGPSSDPTAKPPLWRRVFGRR